MGRTIYWMNVSMDLRIGRAADAEGDEDWLHIGEQLHRYFNARAGDMSVIVHGRAMYEIMEDFWPQAAEDPDQPDYIQEYGQIWVASPKVLVSNTRTQAKHDTRIIGGEDALDQLAALKDQTDGAIEVGGATLATQLLRRGLLDELLLFVHPVVLGSGRPLFDDGVTPVACDLLDQRTFEMGVVMLHYAVEPQPTQSG